MIDDAHRADAGPDKLRRNARPRCPGAERDTSGRADGRARDESVESAERTDRVSDRSCPHLRLDAAGSSRAAMVAVLTAVIFSVAILTDTLDGYLARKHNIITRFGKLADPIADKALTGMAFIGLVDH